MSRNASANHSRILAIDPVTRGFGFAVLESHPRQLVDWEVANCRKNRKSKCWHRVTRLVNHYQPTVIVLEKCERRGSLHCHRVQQFLEPIRKLAREKGIEIRTISWAEVRRVFAEKGATTKHQIATAIAGMFPELADRLPRPREIWQGEDYRMGIFDAVALGLSVLGR